MNAVEAINKYCPPTNVYEWNIVKAACQLISEGKWEYCYRNQWLSGKTIWSLLNTSTGELTFAAIEGEPT